MLYAVGIHAAGLTRGLLLGTVASLFAGGIPYLILAAGVRRGRFTDMHLSRRDQRPVMLAVGLVSVSVGLAVVALLDAPRELFALVGAMVAGVAVALLISAFWKISIHTSVTAGSVTILVLVFGPWALLLSPLPAAVGWARVRLAGALACAGPGGSSGRRCRGLRRFRCSAVTKQLVGVGPMRLSRPFGAVRPPSPCRRSPGCHHSSSSGLGQDVSVRCGRQPGNGLTLGRRASPPGRQWRKRRGCCRVVGRTRQRMTSPSLQRGGLGQPPRRPDEAPPRGHLGHRQSCTDAGARRRAGCAIRPGGGTEAQERARGRGPREPGHSPGR